MIAPGRTSAGPEETRARIIAATREIFERKGTRGTTTREVAERAGVNEATLFRHFGTKQALLDAMRNDACGLEELRGVIARLPGDLESDLNILAVHAVQSMQVKRAMICVQLAEDAGDVSAPEWRGPVQMMDEVAAYFARRRDAGVVKGDPELLARFFMGMFFSYVVGRKVWQNTATDPHTLRRMVDVFLNGVRA